MIISDILSNKNIQVTSFMQYCESRINQKYLDTFCCSCWYVSLQKPWSWVLILLILGALDLTFYVTSAGIGFPITYDFLVAPLQLCKVGWTTIAPKGEWIICVSLLFYNKVICQFLNAVDLMHTLLIQIPMGVLCVIAINGMH